MRIEMCVDILVVLFHLIRQNCSRLTFYNALVAYYSVRMFPLSYRPLENAAQVSTWKSVKSIIFVLHMGPDRTLCSVKLRLKGVSVKRMEYGVLMV